MKIAVLSGVLGFTLAGCTDEDFFPVGPGGGSAPAQPVNFDARYFDRTVVSTWDLGAGWNGEAFRVWSRRLSDSGYTLIAEVSSCAEGFCSYVDRNITPGVTYNYFVSAYDPDTGLETDSDFSVDVAIPQPVPPPVPNGLFVLGLDDANYLSWSDNARDAEDFLAYRVYLGSVEGGPLLIGETDSEGFLDLLAINGETSQYLLTSIDDQGHESGFGAVASGTPRPDFHGEVAFAFEDVPAESGFRFQESDQTIPVLSGFDPARHLRFELVQGEWWLVPGPAASVNTQLFETTALRCGPASDAQCAAIDVAPTAGYTVAAVPLLTQTSYVLRVEGDDGLTHYGVIRVEVIGFNQSGEGLVIFDWAYQLQPGNLDLLKAGD